MSILSVCKECSGLVQQNDSSILHVTTSAVPSKCLAAVCARCLSEMVRLHTPLGYSLLICPRCECKDWDSVLPSDRWIDRFRRGV